MDNLLYSIVNLFISGITIIVIILFIWFVVQWFLSWKNHDSTNLQTNIIGTIGCAAVWYILSLVKPELMNAVAAFGKFGIFLRWW